MATRQQAPAEPSEQPPQESPPSAARIDKDDLKEALREILPEFLTKEKPAASTPPDDDKPEGPRQEEHRWRKMVEEQIEVLKSQSKPEPAKTEEKAPPETTPHSAMRKVEKFMGWH